MTNQIEALRNGLVVDGHRYDDGDILNPTHHTHDVVQAADEKIGPLKGWVKRRRYPAKSKSAATAPQGASEGSSPPLDPSIKSRQETPLEPSGEVDFREGVGG